MAKSPDRYGELGVHPDADAAEIRSAWIRAARVNHPDQRGDVNQEEAERSDRRMRAVNEAWRGAGECRAASLLRPRTGSGGAAARVPDRSGATSACRVLK